MALKDVRLTGTTNGSGALTVTSAESHTGLLYAVEWIDGTFDNGVDAVLSTTATTVASGVAHTLLTLTDANDDAWYYPREAVQDNAGADVTYDGTNEIYSAKAVINGNLQLVVSSGGDTKTGGCIVYYEAY